MAYVDNCQGGIIAAEIQELQQSVNIEDILQTDQCGDAECCGDRPDALPPEQPLAPATPADKVRSHRHLLQNPAF